MKPGTALGYLLSCLLDASCMACDFRISLNHAMCTFWREETAFITQQTPISDSQFGTLNYVLLVRQL